MHIFINGRSAKDRVIQHAIFDGYAGRIVKGQFPMAVVYVRIPFDQVDVNVHPSKNEVRFIQQKRVHDAIRAAVGQALDRDDSHRWNRPFQQEKMHAVAEKKAGFQSTGMGEVRPAKEMRRHPERRTTPTPSGFYSELTDEKHHQTIDHPVKTEPGPPEKPESMNQVPAQAKLWDPARFSELKIIGQYQDIYIVCEAGQDLVLLDQHAAHERILYEKLRRSGKTPAASQGLLLPEILELNYREATVLETVLPQLNRMGFEIEPFGGQTYAIKSVPAILDSRDIKTLMIEIVEKRLENRSDKTAETALDDCIKLMACHGAIRANQRLTSEQIKAMLEQLDACENPSNCPHGRPTWIVLSKGFFEKAFKRILT